MQGCALTAPGRLRRLTFGLGWLKIFSWSPGQATGWCWFLNLQSKKKKENVIQSGARWYSKVVPCEFTCNIIIDFDRDKLHSNFIMIVITFSFFDLALDLVPPKFVIWRVLSMSEKCRLSFTNSRFQFFRDPGTVSWVFLNYFLWKEGINSRSKFHHQQPELVFTRLSIKNLVPVLLGHPSPQRTPCTIAHIALLYFLNDRFVVGWYHWSGQDGIMIRWCDFGQLRYTEQLWSICKKTSPAWDSRSLHGTLWSKLIHTPPPVVIRSLQNRL